MHVLAIGLLGVLAAGLPAAERAAEIVEFSRAPGGICAVVGSGDAELALALAKQGSFVVQVLCAEEDCPRVRQAIRAAGAYGEVSADVLPAGRLPHVDNLLNIVVADRGAGLSPAEAVRALAPLGVAYLEAPAKALDGLGAADVERLPGGWVRLRKSWPAEIDQWTHYLHAADGNPVARDTVVGPPKHYQWIAGPVWQRCHETDSSVCTLVTAAGRIFAIVDEAPISLAGNNGLPDKWFLVARDAFNGVDLWKVPIRRWGWREWKNIWFNARPGDIPLNIQKRLVANGDRVYATLGYKAPVSELDARTGAILQTYAGTERTGEILLRDGTLILSLLGDDGVYVAAVDAASGRRLWTSGKGYRGSTVDYIKWKEMNGGGEPVPLDPTLNMACDAQTVALIDGPDVVGLDARSGREKWRLPFPEQEADRTAGGVAAQGNAWVGAMIVRDGMVITASPSLLVAIAADSGKLAWSQPKKYIGHLWYEWKDVFVIGQQVWTWGTEFAAGEFPGGRKGIQRTTWPTRLNGYNLHTGAVEKEVDLGPVFNSYHHHRCYRNKATERFVLASRRGTEFIDLAGGPHTIDNWVRGTCHVGMMPANGLHYAPPHPCQCYIQEKLNGFNALASAERGGAEPLAADGPLQRGPAFGKIETSAAGAGDWPTFRRDAMRSGSVKTRLPDEFATLWQAKLGAPLSAPVVAAGRVYVAAVDAHHVLALDARDGRKLWEFAAGARIDSPPTYAAGALVFGSADGWAYCLRASDGQLAWRRRAAPAERTIGAFGQLESAWPVSGSVLVEDGTAYLAAGRSSHLDGGIFLYGLDVATGAVRHQGRLEGPSYTSQTIERNFNLPQGWLPDVLSSDGARIYMRSTALDKELKLAAGKPSLMAPAGFLDGNYFKRVPWTVGGQYARIIVHDDETAYYVRMFDTLRGLDPTVFFSPGVKGYLLFARGLKSTKDAWSQRIPVRARAMVLADGRLVLAGPPDVIDPEDPLGAFEGRKGGVLWMLDAASGERLSECRLASPPIFNGAAAAGGRLFVVQEDGAVACLGKK